MKTLEVGQIINLHGIKYEVSQIYPHFLHNRSKKDNDEVFEVLGIKDPYEFCSKFYKSYEGGVFPPAPDLESLTACVEALMNYVKPIETWSEFIDIYTKHYKNHDLSSLNLPLSTLIERGLDVVSKELLIIVKN